MIPELVSAPAILEFEGEAEDYLEVINRPEAQISTTSVED